MKYVSIFSGIEAASVAWEPLGWEPMAFSEIDPFPCAVLAERYPDVPNLGDITWIDWRKFASKHGKPDLVVGGSPCQSFSVAGTRTGLEGASGLMWEYVRAVRDLMPEWIVWENVPGALSSSSGEDFRCLLRTLDEIGYGLAWRVLDAQFFDLAQRRERLFLVGRLGDVEGPCEVLFEPESLLWDTPSSREKRKELASGTARCAGFGYKVSKGAGSIGYDYEICPTLLAGRNDASVLKSDSLESVKTVGFAQNSRDEVRLLGGDGSIAGALSASPGMKQTTYVATIDCRNYSVNEELSGTLQAKSNGGQSLNYVNPVMQGTVVRRLTPRECERLQGFPDDWTLVPYKGKTEDDCPDSPRYKALGNSMAVPVMRWIGRRIEVVA